MKQFCLGSDTKIVGEMPQIQSEICPLASSRVGESPSCQFPNPSLFPPLRLTPDPAPTYANKCKTVLLLHPPYTVEGVEHCREVTFTQVAFIAPLIPHLLHRQFYC